MKVAVDLGAAAVGAESEVGIKIKQQAKPEFT